MDNTKEIKNSANEIKKIYDNLSYLDQYGGSVFLFIIITAIVFYVHVYYSVMTNVQPIKDDWAAQRCNPVYIPFAGLINKPPHMSTGEYTQQNFSFCIQSILISITNNALQPFVYTTNVIQSIMADAVNALQSVRKIVSNIRGNFANIAQEIMGRVANIMVPIQQILIVFSDTMSKVQGVMTAGLYTSLGSYLTLKSLLGAIAEFVIKILLILVIIIIGLWMVPFSWPFAATASLVFLGISIPMAIIVVFLKDVLHIDTPGIPGLPSKPSFCFDKNTPIPLYDGTHKYIIDVKVGDKLLNGESVTATLILNAANVDMYDLHGIVVSGCHTVKYNDKWISVKNHPDCKQIKKYNKPYIYCLNTSSKEIIINNTIFSDWDELYGENIIKLKFNNTTNKITNDMIHSQYDGGFVGNTLIKMKNDKEKYIKDISIGDILANGDKVEGLVKVNGQSLNQYTYIINNLVTIKGGPNLIIKPYKISSKFISTLDNLDNIVKQLNKVKEPVLYHILTNKQTFNVEFIEFYDYNATIDLFL